MPRPYPPTTHENACRFLADLDKKDAKQKIEEAAQAMDYFVRGDKVGR